MKAIILARVSDKHQDSNEAQLGRISDVPKRFGVEIFKTYEIQESSTKGDRKKFQDVIKDIKTSREMILLVVDTVDRLQRSFKESVVLDEFRKEGKLQIHFYRENLTIHKDSNSSDLLRWDMAVVFSKSYVLQLSDNVKRKQDQMRKDGEWTGKPPIGYKSIYNKDGERINIGFDPKTFHLIKQMFELYATGSHSLLTLRKLMAETGLNSSSGKPLAVSMIEHILKNTFYYGEAYSKIKNLRYKHKFEPLISRELFDKCQDIRKNWGKKPFKYGAKDFIFKGLVRCEKCGCAMSPQKAKGIFVFYVCTNARKELCNEKVYVPERNFLKPVMDVLGSLHTLSPIKMEQISEELKKLNHEKDVFHTNAISALRTEYDSIQNKLSKILDIFISGSITQPEYDTKVKELKDRQHVVNTQLEEYTKADENYYLTASMIFSVAKNAIVLFESSEVDEKRQLLNYVLQNCISGDKSLKYSLRKPFDRIEILATQKQPNMLGR